MKFLLKVVATLITASVPVVAAAEAWPSRPVTIVVPFAPGGPTDQVTRQLSIPLAQALGQPVVVENIAGASGTIGTSRVANADPDGYTFVLGASSNLTIAPQMMKLSYDPLTSLTPVGGWVNLPYVLITNKAVDAKDSVALAAISKAESGGLTFGSAGVGTGAHLTTEIFRTYVKGDFRHVPYKGSALAQSDLLGGHIDFMFDVVGTAEALVKAGKVRALGVSSKSRVASLPDVPSISESVPGFERGAWYAYFAPKGTPQAIVDRLQKELNEIFRTQQMAAFFESKAYEPVYSDLADLSEMIREEYDLFGKVISDIGMSAN